MQLSCGCITFGVCIFLANATTRKPERLLGPSMGLARWVRCAHAKLLQAILSNWGVLTDRIPQTKKARIKRTFCCLAHPERFELPTKWFEASLENAIHLFLLTLIVRPLRDFALPSTIMHNQTRKTPAHFALNIFQWTLHRQ